MSKYFADAEPPLYELFPMSYGYLPPADFPRYAPPEHLRAEHLFGPHAPVGMDLCLV